MSLLAATAACGPSLKQVRPVAPSLSGPAPIADPPSSRLAVHASITADAIRNTLEAGVPIRGEGEAAVLSGRRLRYTFRREPLQVRFDGGRISISAAATGAADYLGAREFPVRIAVSAEPVVGADLRALLRNAEVHASAKGPVERINRALEERLEALLAKALEEFQLDLRPLVAGLVGRLDLPAPLATTTCGRSPAFRLLQVTAIEAAPSAIAETLGQELSLIVSSAGGFVACAQAGSVTGDGNITQARPAPALPPVTAVAALAAGPTRLTVQVPAFYEELQAAIDAAVGGRLSFSRLHPRLFVERPRVFPSDDQVVLQVSIGGSATLAGQETQLTGELYFAGHPKVAGDRLALPDLQLTAATADALAAQKVASFDQDALRDQARAALQLDLGARLRAVANRLSKEVSSADGAGCVRAEAPTAEVSQVQVLPSFLSALVQVDARAALELPCR